MAGQNRIILSAIEKKKGSESALTSMLQNANSAAIKLEESKK